MYMYISVHISPSTHTHTHTRERKKLDFALDFAFANRVWVMSKVSLSPKL